MHDDQHGTAIVVLAGLINSAKLAKKQLSKCKIVIVGAGAAGTAIAKLLHLYAKPEIIAVDSVGILSHKRGDLNKEKQMLLEVTNPENVIGSLSDALNNADIFIGVSKGNLLNTDLIKLMNKNPIIFAMANPIPEIMPGPAKKAGALIVATGRSDLPNQVNNALVFPGIFRGALDNHVKKITDQHKIAVAEKLASLVKTPTVDEIIPSIQNKTTVEAIAKVII
jgi:malate dehydrogenase (oxaloacetate-decarboxylating)